MSAHCVRNWLIDYRIWLGELSRELPPSTHFDGFDISDAQYPPQNWYGPKTKLQKLDIFKPLPEELVGKYDVVHLRFFMTIAKDSDIGVALGNLRRMLSMFFLLLIFTFLGLPFIHHSNVRVPFVDP